jgi:hypothetical protein
MTADLLVKKIRTIFKRWVGQEGMAKAIMILGGHAESKAVLMSRGRCANFFSSNPDSTK